MLRAVAIPTDVLQMAMEQGGVVGRRGLLDRGYSRHWIDREVRARRLTLIKPGVYRVLQMTGHLDLVRAAAVALPSAVVSHESAAVLLRFPDPPPVVPTVTVRSGTTHAFPGVTVRRTDDLTSGHTVRVDGLRVTHVMRTLFDLAAVIPPAALSQTVDDLVRTDRLDIRRFAAFAGALSRKGKPGSAAVGELIDRRLAVHATSTELERLGSRVLRDHGLPDPKLQYPAPWNQRLRIDAAYPDHRLGIEWDSRSWHLSYDQMQSDRERDRAAAVHGWVLVRYTWSDLRERPAEVAAEIGALLASRAL